MRLGYCSNTWGDLVGHPAGVTSVKELFYLVNGPIDTAVREIAEVGYEGLELFDGNLVQLAAQPDQFRQLLAESHLELVSVYTGANFIYEDALPDELHRIHRAAQLAAEFGASRLVVGGGARRAAGSTDADYRQLGAALDRVATLAEDFGLSASYHPHLGTIVESPEELDRIMDRTRIGFCPDVAHLAAGGGDPVEAIRKYHDRIAHVHLKDFRAESSQFLPLGEGDLDMQGIVRAVMAAGYDSWLMVELDTYDGAPRAAAEISKRYLDNILPRP